MNSIPHHRSSWRAIRLFLCFLPLSTIIAQPVGSIVGRVADAENPIYLHSARVSIEGSGRAVLTDELGEFRLPDVPPGAVRLRVFHTGFPAVSLSVTVSAGQVTRQDVTLSRSSGKKEGDAVVLDAYVVESTRETDARAIAINEQRFASNIKNVVSTNEFGDLGENKLGDFLKFVPGVTVDGEEFQNQTSITLRGMPPFSVSVTVDGSPLATSAGQPGSDGGSRAVNTNSVAMNGMSRVEVIKTPTPDISANSLGGSLNLVSKRAFERKTPLFNYHTYLWGSGEYKTLAKVPGPSAETTARRITPGMDFSYVAPISKNFGFTLTGMGVSQINSQYNVRPNWAPNAQGGVWGPGGSDAANPYLIMWEMNNYVTYKARRAFTATLDWRFREQDILSVRYQYTNNQTDHNTIFILSNTQGDGAVAPVAYGPTFTQGASRVGRLQYGGSFTNTQGNTGLAGVEYTHNGSVWKLRANASYSISATRSRDTDANHFRSVNFSANNVTIRFDDVGPLTLGKQTATDSTGQVLAPYKLSSYRLIQGQSQPRDEVENLGAIQASAQRHFAWVAPTQVKVGVDYRNQIRDIRSPTPRWDFVGPDKIGNTADDSAALYDVLNTGFTLGSPIAGVKTIDWPSTYKVYDLMKQHPEYWSFNEQQYLINSVSQRIEESVSAAFVRADTSLLSGRLRAVGGFRFERTEGKGVGLLNDIRATYQQDSQGNLILDAQSRPIRISTDATVRARAQYKERGAHGESTYQGVYPSLNLSYNITDNLIGRAAYARTIGRPNLGNIIPSISIADPSATSTSRTISVNNPRLKPWTSNGYDLSLEYYFKRSGVASVSVFRRNMTDFFGTLRIPATIEALEPYGLPDDYVGYDIITRTNIGDARVDGLELNYSQSLGILAKFMQSVEVFANGTSLRLLGPREADFSSFVRRTYNWGVSYSKPAYSIRFNWSKRGRQRGVAITGTNIPADNYQWTVPFTYLDINGDCRITKSLKVYAVVRNVNSAIKPLERYNPATPDYAKRYNYGTNPMEFSIGVKGEF